MFLELIENLKRLFDSIKGRFERKIKQYRVGIQKIVETQAIVTKMSEELQRKKPQLVEMNGVLKDIQAKIDSEQEVITPIYNKVQEEEEVVKAKFAQAQEIKVICERDLSRVMPKFEEAKAAINTIKDNELFELKGYSKPSEGVLMVMTTICIILQIHPPKGKSPDYWKLCQTKLFTSVKYIKNLLLNIKPEDIKSDAVKRVREEFLCKPQYNPASVANVSRACESFCKWVIAACDLEEAFKEVKPKMEQLKVAEQTAEDEKKQLTQK